MKKVTLFAAVALVSLTMGMSSCGSKDKPSESTFEESVQEMSDSLDSMKDSLINEAQKQTDAIDDATSETETTETTSDESESTSSVSSSDFDEALAAYEEFVDQYVSYIKKAANGDVTALAEYPGLLAKAEKAQKKIEDMKGDLTSAQIAKYTKVVTKMTKAMSEMSK